MTSDDPIRTAAEQLAGDLGDKGIRHWPPLIEAAFRQQRAEALEGHEKCVQVVEVEVSRLRAELKAAEEQIAALLECENNVG